MNIICEEFDLRIKNEEVVGTCQWIRDKYEAHSYQEINVFTEYALAMSKDNFTPKQHLISQLSLKYQVSVTHIQELVTAFTELDEEDIAELMIHYNLEKPLQRYEEIKTAIAAPSSYLTGIPYLVIYELYQRGKVPFDRQIFAACLIRFNVWHGANYQDALSAEAKQTFDAFFPKDDFTLDVLMAVFEMELGVENAFYVEREFTIAAIIIELVNRNKITRATIQQKLFDAFNNPTLKQTTHNWAKNIYRDLDFSVEENIACQDQLIQLMYNSRNLLVNFALQQLKKIADHQSFKWKLFISSLDGIVYAEKLTGGLKTALKMLHKRLKKDRTLIEAGCVNLAPVFLQEDHSVQMAAKPCFELLDAPNEAVMDALAPFVDTMHSEVKSALSHLIEEGITHTTYEIYKPQVYTPASCTEEGKITYVLEEDDFIFLASKVLKSQDALDYELFLEAILRYSYLKDTHLKALKLALKQARKIAEEEYLDVTARIGMHHVMVAKLICLWLADTPDTIATEMEQWEDKMKKESWYTYSANRWFGLFNQFKQINFIVNQLRQKEPLPLLSTPTHHQFEIDPNILFERLKQYKKAGKTPNETDFCIALVRLNRWTSFDKSNLSTSTEYDVVLGYLLGDKAKFDPTQMKELQAIWMTAYMLKNPVEATTGLFKKYNREDWWEITSLWDWEINKNFHENGRSWTNLDIGFEQRKIDNIDSSKNSYFEHHLSNTEFIIADVSHWFARDRFLQEPLYLNVILRVYRYFYDMEASELKSAMEVVKHSAQHPVPLGRVGYLFLTLCLFSSKNTLRTATFDWLSLLIENQCFDMEEFTMAVAKMVASTEHPIPIPRVVEQFDRLLSMQGVYIDILYRTIEACITHLNVDYLPKSFNKILHHYYEVLQSARQEIPPKIVQILEQMLSVNAVKKEAKKLLGLLSNET